MSFKIEISSNAAQVLRELDTFPARMSREIARAIDRQNAFTVGQIQRERLTGHPPQPYPPDEGRLRLITGTYRQRTAWLPAVVRGNAVEGAIVVGVGYATAQEFGFRGTVTVPGHQRRSFTNIGPSGRTLKKKRVSGTYNVRPYTMNMNLPARAPISRGIESRLPEYGRAIDAAILAAWEGGRS